jgi:hypothetical protein
MPLTVVYTLVLPVHIHASKKHSNASHLISYYYVNTFFVYIFGRQGCVVSLCLCCPLCIFGKCLNSNPGAVGSRRPTNLATHLPETLHARRHQRQHQEHWAPTGTANSRNISNRDVGTATAETPAMAETLLQQVMPAVQEEVTLYRKSDFCVPKNETVWPRSQLIHSCIYERFIYSQDRSAYLAAAK